MRAFLKAAALAAALFVLFPLVALAQDASSSAVAVVTGRDVTVQTSGFLNPIIEFVGGLLTLAVAGLVAMVVNFLPGVVRPFITAQVQAAITKFIQQGIGWAIQEVEGFDKDKVVNFNAGSAGVASALAYVLNQAPAFLIKLAGGKDAITNLIVSELGKFGIVLDTGVSAQQVASTAAKST
jgi:hypothetical protein